MSVYVRAPAELYGASNLEKQDGYDGQLTWSSITVVLTSISQKLGHRYWMTKKI